MADIVTGPNAATVRTKQGDVLILRDQPLPDNLVDGERDRLDKLGVFGTPTAPLSRTVVVAGEVPADTPLTAAGEAAALAAAAGPTPVEGDEGEPETVRRARRTS